MAAERLAGVLTAFAILVASYLLLFGRAAAFFTSATLAAGFFATGFAAAGFLAAGFAAAGFAAARPRPRPLTGASLPLRAGALSAERPVASSCERRSAATSDGTDSVSMPPDMLERLEPSRCERSATRKFFPKDSLRCPRGASRTATSSPALSSRS